MPRHWTTLIAEFEEMAEHLVKVIERLPNQERHTAVDELENITREINRLRSQYDKSERI